MSNVKMLAACLAAALCLGAVLLIESRQPEPPAPVVAALKTPESVVLKTKDFPEGKCYDISPASAAPAVQWWYDKDGRYFVLHEDGLVTYQDQEALTKLVGQ